MAEFSKKLVKEGYWLYEGVRRVPVRIYEINFDYSYEFAKFEGILKDGQEPHLNADGRMYIVYYDDDDWDIDNDLFFASGSVNEGGLSLSEAISRCGELWNPVYWIN